MPPATAIAIFVMVVCGRRCHLSEVSRAATFMLATLVFVIASSLFLNIVDEFMASSLAIEVSNLVRNNSFSIYDQLCGRIGVDDQP